jgi:hypothetical protein
MTPFLHERRCEFRYGGIGMLVPLLKSSLDRKTKAGFMAMNEALKRKAERSSK